MFSFKTATQILFGAGSLKKVMPTLKTLGVEPRSVMVVTGRNAERAAPLFELLKPLGISYVTFGVHHEPTTDDVNRGSQLARESKVDCVFGYGGGSVIDTAKAIAMLVTNGGNSLDYLEVIGQGKPIAKPSLPCIAITTTSGTGAEVTKNAVVNSVQHRQKASLRSAFMYPTLAVVDPLLTISTPPHVTAASGLDAFTQCLEPFVSCLSNPLCDAIAIKGLKAGAQSLRQAYINGEDLKARTGMSLCSLFGGLALANSKLGAVHGFAGVVGGLCQAPHGLICAALLPHVIRTNIKALTERDPSNAALAKYTTAAHVVLGTPNATANDLINWVQDTCRILNVPKLSEYGLQESDFDLVIQKSAKSSSMKGNPIKLTPQELRRILAAGTLARSAL